MKEAIDVIINGEKMVLETDPQRRLLDVLREDLNLLGTKEGCDTGHCGTCHVLVDNVPTRSCITQAGKVRGKAITTIEGIGSAADPHPIQEAFVRKGAVQCGFCTPGMILVAKALLDRNPDPTPQDVVQALANNLCRCTGYAKVIEAVLEAARVMREGAPAHIVTPAGGIGDAVPQFNALARATGEVKFAADINMEGMLHARVLRSPHAHARILRIDTSEAEAMPDVAAVLTARDVPGVNRVGRSKLDEPVLAEEKVRHVGEPVAVVAAASAEMAQRALGKIKVEYEMLPAVFDPALALEPDAPRVHDDGNLLGAIRIARGDVKSAFQDSAVVVDDVFSTPYIEHGYLEPEAGVAYIDDDGRVTVCAPVQNLLFMRGELARVLGLEPERVRIVHPPTGGAFGGKYDVSVHGVLALLAQRLRRPVKMVYTRQESLTSSTKRHPYRMTYRIGAKKDGRLTALQAELLSNSGAYASLGPIILGMASMHASGPYHFPNVLVEGKLVYTNGAVAGAMRGFGVPQVTFAVESMMDILARELGIDPLEIRRINALRPGNRTATGQVLAEGLGLEPVLELIGEHYQAGSTRKATEAPTNRPDGSRSDESSTTRRGVGVAGTWFGVGIAYRPDASEAAAELTLEGRVRLFLGGPDEGQGANTTMAQIAAQELGVCLSSIDVVTADTAVTPDGGGTYHSRQTYRAGNAALLACRSLKKAILETAARAMEVPIGDLELSEGNVVARSQHAARASLAEVAALCREANVPLKYLGRFERPLTTLDPHDGQGDAFDTYAFGAHVAEVEVNVRTGEVKVLRLVAAHDVGRAINPMAVEAQIQGAAMMGLGFALKEEFVSGKTHTLGQYKLPGTLDMPEIVTLIGETWDAVSPLGAKGVGEIPLYPVAPAIANAICDACGVRLRDLPMTPERLLEGLKSASM